ECQIYADDGARNLCTFRRALLGLVKDNSFKDSVAGKMQRACWDQGFRLKYFWDEIHTKRNPPLSFGPTRMLFFFKS
ncbi:hypothetical protein, partial [Psychromonas hadalis]|uniref:hypothetical protein n=1 Tax=Psychromonas hadalis TaxID=211669 RepID=UPI003CCB75F6